MPPLTSPVPEPPLVPPPDPLPEPEPDPDGPPPPWPGEVPASFFPPGKSLPEHAKRKPATTTSREERGMFLLVRTPHANGSRTARANLLMAAGGFADGSVFAKYGEKNARRAFLAQALGLRAHEANGERAARRRRFVHARTMPKMIVNEHHVAGARGNGQRVGVRCPFEQMFVGNDTP